MFAGAAEQFGIYAGTYGIAATWLRARTRRVIVGEKRERRSTVECRALPFVVNDL